MSIKDTEPMENYEKSTFLVQVQTRRNHTWQGKITWADTQRVQYFRSALELIKLIDSAVEDDEDLKDAPR